MKPWTSWLAQVGLAGSCLIWVGCGGNSASESDSDTQTAGATAPGVSAPEGNAAPGDSAPDPAATSAPGSSAGDSATTAAVAEEAPAAKPEGPSATNEMLALATGSAGSSSDTPASGGAPGSSGGGAPSFSGGGAPGSSGGGAPGASGAMPNAMPAPGAGPAASGAGPSPAEIANAALANDGAVGLAPDVAMNLNEPIEGVTTRGGSLDPKVFKSPFTAANAFLSALQKKNPEWLAETTALRAPTEASAKYQKVFTAILEQSLAPEDLDELAKKFEGMKIMGNETQKSTGRYGIIVGKMAKNGSSFHRTITLRKEKLGWKVVDISGVREFEKPIIMPRGGMRGMGGGRR